MRIAISVIPAKLMAASPNPVLLSKLEIILKPSRFIDEAAYAGYKLSS
jgi:hypothetical protein